MASVVAIKVFGTVITVLPGCTPAAIRANRSASVPLPTPTQYWTPQNRANSCSNSSTISPPTNTVAHENIVLDGYPFTYKTMARDLAVFPYFGIFLNFDKCTNLGVVANFAAIEIDELRELCIFSQSHVRGDALKTVHRVMILPLS